MSGRYRPRRPSLPSRRHQAGDASPCVRPPGDAPDSEANEWAEARRIGQARVVPRDLNHPVPVLGTAFSYLEPYGPCSGRSTASWTCPSWSTRSSSAGGSATRWPDTWRATRSRSGATASWTDRSRPTTRWACTTPGAARTRTSSSATTRCSASVSATRTGSTARGCGSRSRSRRSSASTTSARSSRSASIDSSSSASSGSTASPR